MKSTMRIAGLLAVLGMTLSACGGGGGGGTTQPPIPQVTPTPTITPAVSADCPTSGSLPSSVAQQSLSRSSMRARSVNPGGTSDVVPGTLIVTYRAPAVSDRVSASLAARRVLANTDFNFSALGLRAKVVAVDPSEVTSAMTQLRSIPGVLAVQQAHYRHALSAGPPNDPFYTGTGVPPYYETSSTNGQWDMHVMRFDNAWARFAAAPVVGAPIAVIDTGVDVTQLELTGGKIVRTQCYVTYPSGTAQTSGPYITDMDGHGTDIAGIADADTNNGLLVAGAGWSAPLLAYRIFPSPPSAGCEGSTSSQCSTSDVDEVSAINDAVAHGAKVINLSLGADPPCTDSIESTAVESAISSGVVVVAAAGNGNSAGTGQNQLDCPASYPGVIAVGASALNDTSSPITEKVASYSNYLTTNGGGYYMIAPGGDPCPNTPSGNSCNDSDSLHWVINLDSSTYSGAKCSTQCLAEFAGTSQATPHVAGVVSLMRAINPRLTPAQIATDLCSTADNISDSKQGCGRVNAGAAVTLAASQ